MQRRGTQVPGFASGYFEELERERIFESSEHFRPVPCDSDDDNDDVVNQVIMNYPDNMIDDQDQRKAIIDDARAFLNDAFGDPYKLISDQDKLLSSDPTKYFSSVILGNRKFYISKYTSSHLKQLAGSELKSLSRSEEYKAFHAFVRTIMKDFEY